MDSSKIDLENQIAAIKKSILDGRLTQVQIHRILALEIDKELSKPLEEIDMEYVNACQNFLECMSKEKASQTTSHSEKNYAAIQKKLHNTRSHFSKKKALRIAIVSVCILVVFFSADILLTARRIDTSLSPDHDQFIVQGTVASPNTIDKAEADACGDEIQSLSTDSWPEMVAFLGFEPSMPTWLPDGWIFDQYDCYIMENSSDLLVTYLNKETSELLQYSVIFYHGSDVVRIEYEQNPTGGEQLYINGYDVNINNNLESAVAIWNDGQYISSLNGPITKEILIAIVNSINSGEKEQ